MNAISTVGIDNVKLINTIKTIRDTVASTMGPNGNTCILYNGNGIPHVTKDGVTVAEFLQFNDPEAQAINLIIRETARQTGKIVGDGTTTSIVLACELTLAILESEDPKKSLLEVSQQIPLLIKFIQDKTKSMDKFGNSTLKILRSVAYLASNGDSEITDLIMEVIESVGVNGSIDIVLSEGYETITSIQDGMLLESPANVHKTEDLSTSNITLVAGKVETVNQIKSFLNLAADAKKTLGRAIVMVAKEFSKEVRNIVEVNNRRGFTKIYLVEIDGFANNMLDILDDMSLILKCPIMSTDKSSSFALSQITIDDLGLITGATIGPQSSVLYVPEEVYLEPKVVEVKESILESIDILEKSGDTRIGELNQYRKRLNKFSKSATIKVGGKTSAEALERKDRVDDAVSAIHAAVRGGVVPGAGYTLYQASKSIGPSTIMHKVCSIPASRINKDYEHVYTKNTVVDCRTGEKGDAYKLGILDPADVQIQALAQALSIARTIVGSHSILTNTPEGWQGIKEEL